ncbi:unnamed protein product [Allacma fusca]|uniref:Uncharacterized protein n=1 Tax=Allacma fusca TaxID=39272 RepID=A0A8J2K7S2_9HEXA|nr:unnamed protein product [Allacma fusca]
MASRTLSFILIVILHLHYCFGEYEKIGLDEHNQRRASHKTPPMALSPNLNGQAGVCADHYLKQGRQFRLGRTCEAGL